MNAPRAFSPDQWAAYQRDGLAVLPAATARADALAMADALWADLERRYGARRAGPETWTTERPSGFQDLEKTDAFAPSASLTVRSVLDDLLGEGGWQAPTHWGQPLVTFPSPGPWALPHRHWHLDAPATAQDPAVARFFTFLAPTEPRGGGTLYVAGSHRLVQALAAREAPGGTIRSAEVRTRLQAQQPWLAELWSAGGGDRVQRFMDRETAVEGVPLKVGEMTGEPGDVIFMHPLLLHAFAPNVLRTPRMMLTQWIYGVTPPG